MRRFIVGECTLIFICKIRISNLYFLKKHLSYYILLYRAKNVQWISHSDTFGFGA